MSSFIILIFLPICVMGQNYCSISRHHTMCKYQGIGPTCGSDEESGVSHAEIQQILKLHNDFRSKIALGKELRGFPDPQPPAANMHTLVWDDNLAAVAQKWADQCTFQHDECRNDPRFSVGQNMYFSTGFSKVDWTRPISAWYEEVTKFDSKLVNCYKFQPRTAHYTQLVWGNTRYIGCGRTSFGGYYRPRDYQKTEYILSSIPSEESPMDYEERRTDVLPDYISDEDETIIEFEKYPAENSTNKSEKNTSQHQPFAIYIPGYWVPKSQPDKNGKVSGVFQSMNFSEPADVKQFFQKTPLSGATKMKSENPTIENWNFNFYNGQFNFKAKDSLQNLTTQFGYEQSTLDSFGRNQILVCNYGPSGNYLNQPVYIRGQPCSKCLFKSKCNNGLCT